jgi:RNA polymerase sigma-70 factor (ECF subfamily)
MLEPMLHEGLPEPPPLQAPPYIPDGFPDTEGDGRTGIGGLEARGVDDAAALVERARDGDRDAFGELFRLHHGRVYRLARAHLGEAADDVVAETFLRAWRGLGRYRPTGVPFAAWLYGIARHVVADELRRRSRVRLTAEVPDRASESQEDDRLTLAAAIRRLPERQRQVMELKFLVGLSNEEVGRALGKSPGAVNAIQWRALESLRRMLEEAWTGS